MAEKTYTVVASGSTYPIRDDLKSWAFQYDGRTKTWKLDCVSEQQRRHFESEVSDGTWSGVELAFEEEKREPWEDEIDKMESGQP